MVQVTWLGPTVDSRLALFKIHQMNHVNSRNSFATVGGSIINIILIIIIIIIIIVIYVS